MPLRKGPLHEVYALALERVERNIASEIHTANTELMVNTFLSVYLIGLDFLVRIVVFFLMLFRSVGKSESESQLNKVDDKNEYGLV